MNKQRIRYKIYGDCDLAYYQQYTYVDLTGVPRDYNFWNYIEEVLRERFDEYQLEFNHAGKTITIDVDNTTECDDCGREFELTHADGTDVILCDSCAHIRENDFMESEKE